MADSDPGAPASGHRVERPWGWFESLGQGQGYLLKRLCVGAGRRISLQRHHHRSEHWVVVAGSGWVEVDGHSVSCSVGTAITVPCGSVHRVTAAAADLVIIEVQLGELLSESDIERLADDYGRSIG